MTILNLAAKQDHLEKVAKTNDPIKAISEFVWNSLDADATQVSVIFGVNPLGGLVDILIKDNGTGITPLRAAADFRDLGNSWKKTANRTKQHKRAFHGKEGKGRLQFFSLSEHAEWRSTFTDTDGKLKDLTLLIDASSLERCNVSEPLQSNLSSTGTVVTLSGLKNSFDWLLSNQALAEFSTRFASYLMQYKDVVISYNDQNIDPSTSVSKSHDFPVKTLIGPTKTIDDVSLKVIEWTSVTGGRKIHLGGEKGIVLGSQPAHVTAPGFEFSAYANSQFFQEMSDSNLLEIEGLTDPDFKYVMDHIREELGDYFRQRQAEKSKGLIDDLKNEGAYPYEGDPRNEVERRERQVFDIATYAVSSYSRDFKQAETSLKKMTLALLREALRSNPDSISNILQAVVNLPKNRQDEFACLLQKTELSNIISASSLIADRVIVLETLNSLVFSPKHRSSTKERGELDAVVRDNTWLFGERFHITMHEAGLSKVMDRVSEDLQTKRGKAKVVKDGGKKGRVDCFLGRSVPHPDKDKREFLIVELKRPSLIVGRNYHPPVPAWANPYSDIILL